MRECIFPKICVTSLLYDMDQGRNSKNFLRKLFFERMLLQRKYSWKIGNLYLLQ